MYQPQSARKVKRMNRTLKERLRKQNETGLGWVSLLLFVLVETRCTPYFLDLTLYEIMFVRPLPLLPQVDSDKIAELTNTNLLQSLQAFHILQEEIKTSISAAVEGAALVRPHPHAPGDLM